MREVKQPPSTSWQASGMGHSIGVTSALVQRVYQHKTEAIKGFSAKYGCKLLVYYEIFDRMEDAIAREKQLKAGSRAKKIALIEGYNPGWADLYETLL